MVSLTSCRKTRRGGIKSRILMLNIGRGSRLGNTHARIRAMGSMSIELGKNLARVHERIELAACAPGVTPKTSRLSPFQKRILHEKLKSCTKPESAISERIACRNGNRS